MIKRMTLVLTAVLALALLVVGCGSTSQDIKGGATKMKVTLAEVKKAVEAGDQATAKAKADALEEDWGKFEDAVKAKDKAMYADIEDPLAVIGAGTKKAQMDQKAILDGIAKLDGLLDSLVK